MATIRITPRACRTCSSFHASDAQEGQGECRRRAPTVFLVPGKLGGPAPVAAFPPVHHKHWCSEWVDAKHIGAMTAPTQEVLDG